MSEEIPVIDPIEALRRIFPGATSITPPNPDEIRLDAAQTCYAVRFRSLDTAQILAQEIRWNYKATEEYVPMGQLVAKDGVLYIDPQLVNPLDRRIQEGLSQLEHPSFGASLATLSQLRPSRTIYIKRDHHTALHVLNRECVQPVITAIEAFFDKVHTRPEKGYSIRAVGTSIIIPNRWLENGIFEAMISDTDFVQTTNGMRTSQPTSQQGAQR